MSIISLRSTSTASLLHSRRLHAHLLRRGQLSNPFLTTKFLESCAAAGDMPTALHLFHSLPRPNAYMWTAIIRSLVAANSPHKAIHYYSLMRRHAVAPYKFTFLYALKAFSISNALHHGRTLHATLVKTRLDCDAYLRSALVSFYSNCARIADALRVFAELPDQNNSVIWNAAIAGCFANGDLDSARNLFDRMPDRDVTSWNVTVNGYCKSGCVDVARELFDEMPDRDLVSWSAMIGGYVLNGRAGEALDVFDEMVRAGVRPDGVTMTSALSACAQIGALDMGKWIHAYVDKNRLRRDVVLDTSLVDMYAKCACIDLALQVFRGMKQKNVSSWNAMICGLALSGRGSDALALFGKMELVGVVPNDITFVGVLSACAHIGEVDEGRRQFERMCKEFGIDPKVEHYGCMVDLFGRAGLVSEASQLIASMKVELNPVILGAFLSACRMHGDANIGEDVIRELSRLRPGDGGCHVLLSNIYASQNQWDGVAKIRKSLKGMGFRKVPGCSSIEVNSVVHEFVVEDKTHSRWEEICVVINKLSMHLEVEGYDPNSQVVPYDMDDEFW